MNIIDFGFDAGIFLRWIKNRCKGDIIDYEYEDFNGKKKFFSYENRTMFLGALVYLFIFVSDLLVFRSMYVTGSFVILVYGIRFTQLLKRKKREKLKRQLKK